ncbi:hypothetical protein AB4027_04225 [Alkalibacterium putridalgicola]|uniref:Uncharacterized protein n=1 Tax=Alkalibacterium putridalgicola TaxID=426703 RepID=A0A1H7XCA2_9LACT|nr:hypothetical protein [Alkalibacterium putridalgicola]GEK88475.1 hypothetical protein APU01nite_05140 [Alkalibacterium putridalgicola]SEM31254.1 hypothetical protein SAMN04488100_14811 [Alkalibacterium putridalgicola]
MSNKDKDKNNEPSANLVDRFVRDDNTDDNQFIHRPGEKVNETKTNEAEKAEDTKAKDFRKFDVNKAEDLKEVKDEDK